MNDKCDECDTKLISACGRCGAPVCCPLCCAKDEILRLEAELEQSRKNFRWAAKKVSEAWGENAELRTAVKSCNDTIKMQAKEKREMMREVERLRNSSSDICEAIMECGDDYRGACSRIEFKIPNPDGGEFDGGGLCREALIKVIDGAIKEIGDR